MRRIFAAICIAFCAVSFVSAEPRTPTDAEVRNKQQIGRALISPDQHLFVFEWMRPYNWVRDTGTVPKAAAERMQTWLYRVNVDRTPPNCEYIFFPGAASSYWLGALSPDGSKLSFYELDNDERILKTGVVELTDPVMPRLTWFDASPDGTKLNQPPVWLSNDELAYPTQAGMVRAKVASPGSRPDATQQVKTEPCSDCITLMAQAQAAGDAAESAKMDKGARKKGAKTPEDARVLAQSPDGQLTVFERSNKKVVGVLFRKGVESPETIVFENERVLPAWPPTKAVEKSSEKNAE